jgi:hypothetical protein
MDWCMDMQPYYKKHIPEVFNYFVKEAGLWEKNQHKLKTKWCAKARLKLLRKP